MTTRVFPLDQVILVDENDKELGVMDKIDAHRGEGKRHRAISVFLLNAKGELLIQKRSAKKIVGALQWANTCCGNVWPGETYEQCAERRLKVELGILHAKILMIYTFEYHVPCGSEFSEWEMDRVFVGQYDGKVIPNPDEVAEYTYAAQDDLMKEMRKNSENFSPWFHIMMKDSRLLTKIGWKSIDIKKEG